MSYKLIRSILTSQWFIQSSWAEAHLPLIAALLNGNNLFDAVPRTGNESTERPFVIDPKTMQRHEPYMYDPRSGRMVQNPNIPPNSVGMIPLTGPLTYYNGDCGEPGMMSRTNWLSDFLKQDNIGSIVQIIDTPGGEGRAAQGYTSLMGKSAKPILSSIDNLCASLGMWFSSGSDETYLSHDNAEMGSVGSFVTLPDFSGALEQKGIKLHTVYAPQSTDKNKNYKDALNGDYSAIQEDLKRHVDTFISYVGDQRGDSAKANTSEWNTGKMFYGNDAVKLGLADGVRPLDQVISKAAWLGKRSKN